MRIKNACAIFKNIQNDNYTDEEKAVAVCEVLKMETHNGITKEEMLSVIEYLILFNFFVKDDEWERIEQARKPYKTT